MLFNRYLINEIGAGYDQWTNLPLSPGMRVLDSHGEKAGKYCVILPSIKKWIQETKYCCLCFKDTCTRKSDLTGIHLLK